MHEYIGPLISYGSEILIRKIKPNDGGLLSEATEWKYMSAIANVNNLAAKARAGDLTAEERAELDDYETAQPWKLHFESPPLTTILFWHWSKRSPSLDRIGLMTM